MKEWLEDYQVGDVIRSPYIRINPDDVRTYARYTHDMRPFLLASVDDDVAERFVPPLYLLAVGMCLLQQAPERSWLPSRLVAFLKFDGIQFPAAANVGDLIYSTARVEALIERGTRGKLVYHHETRNQDDDVLVSTGYSMLVERRPEE